MLNDTFKARYTTIPFATFAREHTAGSRQSDLNGLSHMHREMELLLILDGSARFHIGTDTYEVSAGDLVLISPWCLHRSTIFSDRDLRHICLCFDLSLLHDSLLRHRLEIGSHTVTPVIRGAERYAPLVRQAFDAHAEQKLGWELQVAGCLAVLFGLLQRDGHLYDCTDQPSGVFCRQVSEYISTHYSQSITSSDCADHMHISLSHFCRLFHSAFGQPFQRYLSSYRIEKAKFLLRSTESAISQIALDVGFSGFSYFSNVFRKQTGMTPVSYRNASPTNIRR